MSGETPVATIGKGPFFWAGLMLAAFGAIAGLGMTEAIDDTTFLILMFTPIGLLIPLFNAANRHADAGGPSCLGKGQAQRRYKKRAITSTSLYLLAVAIMTFTLKGSEADPALRAISAILPGLALLGLFWSIGRLIVEEQDEFIRMLVIRQSLIASGLALGSATIWGFLESADVVVHVHAYWWALIWFLGLGVGAVANRIRYGAWGLV